MPERRPCLEAASEIAGEESNGMSGADVEQFYRDGRIREIADSCEINVVNTYRVWPAL